MEYARDWRFDASRTRAAFALWKWYELNGVENPRPWYITSFTGVAYLLINTTNVVRSETFALSGNAGL